MYPTISTNFSLNFTAGLNKKLSAKCLFFESRDLERKLSLYENIDANFKGNKPIAFCLSQIYDIFNQLNIKILKFKFPRFRVFNQSQLAINFKNTAFCLPETQLILKDDLPFETGSIFQKEIDNIEHLNALIEKDYQNGNRSSNHFLADTIHEIMHSIFIDKIYQKYGYNGICPYTKEKYPMKNTQKDGLEIMKELQNKRFSDKENAIIESILGKYAAKPLNQYHEVFAEFFTKLICESLSSKTALPNKNPFENIQKYPKEFLSIIAKIINI